MRRMDVEFTRDGQVYDPAAVTALLDGIGDATDLVVLSHGWNNDLADARALYDALVGSLETLLNARTSPAAPPPLAALRGRTFAVCQLFWPSRKFADADLIPGGGAASATVANDAALERVLEALANDAPRLGGRRTSSTRRQAVARAKALVPALDRDPAAREAFVTILRSLLDRAHVSADDGSDAFFAAAPDALFEQLERTVVAPHGPAVGGASSVSAGGAVGLGDLLQGSRAAARRLANYATYYQMKARAGTVGTTGVAPVLRRVLKRYPRLRIHLVGHSFGGRLVTAAAHALDDDTVGVSMTLLQAAFSHNALSGDFGGGQAGHFRDLVAKKRASGPIVITHTKNDQAVGVAYPLASRIAFQNAAALGDANDPYGGMGRNGAQHTAEVDARVSVLGPVGAEYPFVPGRVHNLLADEFIRDHNDVTGVQVAYAILSVAAAVPEPTRPVGA